MRCTEWFSQSYNANRSPGGFSAYLTLFVLGALLSGCVTAPVAETQYFSKSFAAVDSAGQPLLDELSIAERRVGQQRAARAAQASPPGCGVPWQGLPSNQGFIRGFCLGDAPYFSNVSDPPATLAFRKGLTVVKQYSELLTSLSDGTRAKDRATKLQTLVGNVTQLFDLAPGLGVGSATVSTASSGLAPILEQALRAQSAAEERRLIVRAAPQVSTLIASLRAAAPSIFNILTEQNAENLTSVDIGSAAASDTDLKKIEYYRVAVADYVMLLDKLNESWNQLVQAAGTRPSGLQLATLAAAAEDIAADADAARKALIKIRQAETTPK